MTPTIQRLYAKLRKQQIPNVYYAVFFLATVSVIGVFYLSQVRNGYQQIEEDEANTSVEMSPVSKLVDSRLDIGMTREAVIQVLGRPTWAALSGDRGILAPPDSSIGLELRWENPACRDVLVMFSPPPYRVIGWDSGSHFCSAQLAGARDSFRCERTERQPYCSPNRLPR